MEPAHTEPNYMAVFYWLAALTVIEVGVTFLTRLGWSKLEIGAMLIVLAFTKAALVALFFMHLKFERRTLAVIALTPVLLCVFLIFMLLPDRHIIAPSTAQTSQQAPASR